MRAGIWMVGLLLGMGFAGQARAQALGQFGNSRTGPNNRLAAANRTGRVGSSTFLGSPFRLRELFHGFGSTITNRNPVGMTTVPDPSSPQYLNAFGFKRLK